LKRNIQEQGYDWDRIPLVFQWNKRDLPNIIPTSELEKKLNTRDLPSFAAVASQGEGVFETLKMISKLVLMNIKGGLN
jgi:signal recognition particle receptor subunit beta